MMLSPYMKHVQALSATVLPERLFREDVPAGAVGPEMPVPEDWKREPGQSEFSRVMQATMPNIANEVICWNKVTGRVISVGGDITFASGAGAAPDEIISAAPIDFGDVDGDGRNKFEAGKLIEIRNATDAANNSVFPIIGLGTTAAANDTIYVPNGVLTARAGDAATVMFLSEPLSPAYANKLYPQQSLLLPWKAHGIYAATYTVGDYDDYSSIFIESVTGDRTVPTFVTLTLTPVV